MRALRFLLRAPLVSLTIVASLAIGIGSNTVVFSWLKGAVFQPLPAVDAPVWLVETKDDTGGYVTTAWPEYRDLARMLPSFEGIAAQRPRNLHLGDSEREARVFAELVSANFFEVLAVRPAQGRFFRPDEGEHPGSAPVVVISHDFWQGYFKGAADVLGRTVKLNAATFTVIGVTAPRFRGGMNSLGFDLWIPATMAPELQAATQELTDRTWRPYVMLGRLKPGATPAQAQGELAAAARQMIAAYPGTNKGLDYHLLPLWRSPRGGEIVVVGLVTLQVFATLILIVVCANTANLLLARASARQKEIGVKLALGAGPGRILAQLLVESVTLALLGAGAGLFIALWGNDAMRQMPLPGGLPVRIDPQLDTVSLLFAVGLGTFCGFAFGLAPALQLARGDVLQALRGGRGAIGGRSRIRDTLVGVQVGVALVVLVLAGLYLKSFRNSLQAAPGFDQHRVMLSVLDLGGRGYTRDSGRVFLDQLIQKLEATPGVARAAYASQAPLDLRGMPTGVISVEGQPFDAGRKVLYYSASPGYAATMGVALVAGRDLSPLSRPELPLDALINEEMARRYWPDLSLSDGPGASPVGRRFELGGTFYEIAGVVRNIKYQALNEPPRAAAWLTARGQTFSAPTLHVRAQHGDPRALLTQIRAAVRSLDSELPVLDSRSLGQHLENNFFMQRVPAQMLSILGPIALALPAIGLYAVLAYSLAQRTQEIGVRLTLGATPGRVVRHMMWQHLRIVLIAIVLGWCLALYLGWFLRAQFVGVPIGDPGVYAGAPALLLLVATLACWLPARKAAEVDPMNALRSE